MKLTPQARQGLAEDRRLMLGINLCCEAASSSRGAAIAPSGLLLLLLCFGHFILLHGVGLVRHLVSLCRPAPFFLLRRVSDEHVELPALDSLLRRNTRIINQSNKRDSKGQMCGVFLSEQKEG